MSGPSAASERSVVEALLELALAERERLVPFSSMTIGPFSAFTLIGAIQLAWRHPAMTVVQRQVLEDIARPMQAWFSGILAEALEAGWDVSQDRDPDEVRS